MLKQLEAEIEEKKTEPQDEKDPEPEGTPKSYECTVCGWVMWRVCDGGGGLLQSVMSVVFVCGVA